MNMSRMLKFLVAGIVIGAILFFAGFGVLNLLENSSDTLAVEKQPAPEVIPVEPPKIEVTSSQVSETSEVAKNLTQGEDTSSSPIKIKPIGSDEGAITTQASEEIQKVAFGALTLSTVNSVDGGPTNANFLIENAQSIAIALVKDTSSSTLSLPVGDYKITVSQGAQKVVRFLGVKDGQNGSETFELDVPVLRGETPAPVIIGADTTAPSAAVVTSQASPQPEATVSTTTEATAEPSTANSPDVAAESTNEVSQSASITTDTTDDEPAKTATGGLRLSALTKQGKRPTAVDFYIRGSNGQDIKNFKNVKTEQIILPAGIYKVTAEAGNATAVKEVEVLATKGIHEIFLISAQVNPTQQNTTQNQQVALATAPSKPTNDSGSKEPGKLELFAQKASNNSPLKSNFYIKMPNGSMVASKIYVESIGYKLPAGKYKVIVRATGFKNKSIMLNVRAGQTRREVFKLDTIDPAGANQNIAPVVPQARSTQLAPVTQNTTRAFGGLTVNVVSASDGSGLPSDIVIMQRDGTPLKQMNGMSSASFDLPPREFLIRVTHAGLTTSHQINIVPGRLAIKTISFDLDRMSR